ncbi:MAG: hypothetical protein AAF086_00315 [Planctomycetota bacterium]
MKSTIQLAAVATLLVAVLAAAFHPDFGVLWTNPLALLGTGLIGLGLVRNAQQSLAAGKPATFSPTDRVDTSDGK